MRQRGFLALGCGPFLSGYVNWTYVFPGMSDQLRPTYVFCFSPQTAGRPHLRRFLQLHRWPAVPRSPSPGVHCAHHGAVCRAHPLRHRSEAGRPGLLPAGGGGSRGAGQRRLPRPLPHASNRCAGGPAREIPV